MASVSELGYLGIGVADVDAWTDLATSVFGMRATPGADGASTMLRMDAYRHRVRLGRDGGDDVEFAGWEVPDRDTLKRVAAQLADGGVKVVAGTPADAARRGVIDLVRCVDPNGIATEVFCGRPVDPVPFLPTRPTSGFKTAGMGLGHVLLQVADLDANLRFYRDLLGFRTSDLTDVATPNGTLRLAFLHCNPRHHSIAFIELPGAPRRLNHVMFEANSLADVGTGRDVCIARGVPIAIDLGCHMNDHMVSFYLATPSGFALEYGFGGREIDDATWRVEHYSSIESIWGHPQLRELAAGGPH